LLGIAYTGNYDIAYFLYCAFGTAIITFLPLFFIFGFTINTALRLVLKDSFVLTS